MSLQVDLLVSIGCIIVTLGISQFLREFASGKWTTDFLGRQLFMEFIAAFELTAVAHETSIVFGTGGKLAFALFVFWVWYWRTEYWHGVSATPCSYLQEWVTRRIGFYPFIFVSLAQLCGGFMAYGYYTTPYWRLGLIGAHRTQIHDGFQTCTSHIQVTPLVASMAEAGGIFVYITLAKLIGRTKSLEGMNGLLNAFIGTSLVLSALKISGGYFNPVLASSFQYGCKGSTLFEHIQVYWIGNIVGTLAAHFVDTLIIHPITKGTKVE